MVVLGGFLPMQAGIVEQKTSPRLPFPESHHRFCIDSTGLDPVLSRRAAYIPFLRWIHAATWVPQARGPPNEPRT